MRGFQCDEPGCSKISTSRDEIRKHCYKEHAWKSVADDREHWHAVYVQTMFQSKAHRRYFVVDYHDASVRELEDSTKGISPQNQQARLARDRWSALESTLSVGLHGVTGNGHAGFFQACSFSAYTSGCFREPVAAFSGHLCAYYWTRFLCSPNHLPLPPSGLAVCGASFPSPHAPRTSSTAADRITLRYDAHILAGAFVYFEQAIQQEKMTSGTCLTIFLFLGNKTRKKKITGVVGEPLAPWIYCFTYRNTVSWYACPVALQLLPIDCKVISKSFT